MSRVLTEVFGCVPGEELVIVQRSDGSIELVRLRPRGRRVASLTLDPAEIGELTLALETVAQILRLDARGVPAADRTRWPANVPVLPREESKC